MNFVYLVTCAVICYYALSANFRARKSDRRLTKYLGMVDDLLPKLVPTAFAQTGMVNGFADALPPGDVVTSGYSNAVPTGVFADPIFARDHEEKYASYVLRERLQHLTGKILKEHCFSISYEKAWGIAEDVLVGEYALKDKPLSTKMTALMPTPLVPGSPTDSAPQATMQ
jgi:hypothetical protein